MGIRLRKWESPINWKGPATKIVMITMLQEIQFVEVSPIGRGLLKKIIMMLMVKEIQFFDVSLTHGKREDDGRVLLGGDSTQGLEIPAQKMIRF